MIDLAAGIIICAVLFCACWQMKTDPFAVLLRCALYGRAGSMLVLEMLQAGWARRERWNECKETARRF